MSGNNLDLIDENPIESVKIIFKTSNRGITSTWIKKWM